MGASLLTFLDRAGTMVDYGVPVVPLAPCKKFPPPEGWRDFATTNMEIIKGWLVPNGKPALATEDSNCACVAKPDGVWFFEIDALRVVSAKIEKETGHKLDGVETLIVRSSSDDKRHLYFRQNDASRALGNFDYDADNGAELFSVRGNNKYVVSPHSIHPKTGREYEIINRADIIEAPVWLTDWLKTAKWSSNDAKQKTTADTGAKIHEGGRDEFLFAEACRLRDKEISSDAALVELRKINLDRCVPPMDEAVVRLKITSAYKRPARTKPQHSAENFPESGTSPTPEPDAADVANEPESTTPRLFLFAQKPAELSTNPIEWVIAEMYPLHGISIVAAREGIGKGVHALLSVRPMLRGGSFLGHKVNPVPHVLYVDMENPEAVVRARLAKLGLLDADNLLIWGQWNSKPPSPNLRDPMYMEYAKKTGGFIFFDSLVDFSNGADENNAAEMNEIIVPARLLARHCAGVQIQHHSDKYGKSGWRGTTAITAAVDMAFGIRADDEEAFRKGNNLEVCFSTLKAKMCAPYHINYKIVGWDGQLAYQLISDRKVTPGDAASKVKPPNKVDAAIVLGRVFILDKLGRQQDVTIGDVKTHLEQKATLATHVREALTILRAQFETERGGGSDGTVYFRRELPCGIVPDFDGENYAQE